MLSFVKDDSNYDNRDLNKSAKARAPYICEQSRKKDPIQQGTFDSGALDLLQNYDGTKRSWIWVMWHL